MSILFETDSFRVRPLKYDDLSDFYELQGNQRVMRYTGDKAHTLQEDIADLDKVISAYSKPSNHFWVWAIENKLDGSFLGTCAFVGDKEGVYEIGYRFLEKEWGKGYGKKLANALINYAIQQKTVLKLIAYVDSRNKASVKILNQSILPFIKEIKNQEGGVDFYYCLSLRTME